MTSKVTGRQQGAKSALERQRTSRRRNAYAYTRARNAAEREVVRVMISKHSAVYDELRTAVESEVSDTHRSIRQSRTRSACAAWYRKVHPKLWNKIMDKCVEEVTTGTPVVIHRRKSA